MHISVTIYVDTNVFGIFRWKLVEIDADLSKLGFETKRVMSLINPADTYMVNLKVLSIVITFLRT
jgi:hypothetical protein